MLNNLVAKYTAKFIHPMLNISDSKAVTGTKKLLEDVLKGGAVLVGVGTGVVFFLFLVKGLMASDTERSRHMKTAVTTLVIGGLATLAGAIAGTVMGYYQ